MAGKIALMTAVLSAVMAFSPYPSGAGTLQIIRSIPVPSPLAVGGDLAWDGEHLWATLSTANGLITYELDPLDGRVVSSFDFPATWPSTSMTAGQTWDGTHLWVAEQASETPEPSVPDYIDKILPDGTVVDYFLAPNSPAANVVGLAWDGNSIWMSDGRSHEFFQIDPEDGSVIASFVKLGTGRRLTWDGSSFWGLGGPYNPVVQLDASGNLLEDWSAPYLIAWASPTGITFDGEHLWILTSGLQWPPPEVTPPMIYQLAIPEPSTLLLLGSAAALLLGLAWQRRRNSTTRSTVA